MLKKILTRPLYLWMGAGVLILAGAGFWYFNRSKEAAYEFFTARRGDIAQKVSVTGRVKASEDVNLSFDKSGRVVWAGVRVGDRVYAGQMLVQLYNADLAAQLKEAEADLKAAEAGLKELRRGARLEDLRVQEAKVADAEQNLVDKIQDAFTKADDAVRNRADQLFSSPRSANPQLNFSIDPQLDSDLESGRMALENTLTSWASLLLKLLSADDLIPQISAAKNNLGKVKSFLDKAAEAVNGLKPAGNLTQTIIDSYRSDVSTARSNANTAINNLSSAEADWVIAQRELILKQAGSSAEEISAQEAKVEKAEANVANIKAQLSKTILTSPLTGIITRQEAKAGEVGAANAILVSLISEAEFEIEVNLPEADIAKVKVGSPALVTLDAYGDDVIFEANVVEIEPAETIVEGVTTYKMTLQFNKKDERVRSGMTANADILGERREGVLIIPQRAVISKNGDKFVRVLEGGEVLDKKIITGLRGSDGNVEVLSGLDEGEQVIIF